MLNLFSYPNYEDLRDRADVFDALVAYRFTPIAASANGVNERLCIPRLGQLLRRARRAARDRADDLAGRRCAARRVAGGRDQLPLLAAALRRRRRRDRPSGRRQRPDLHHHRRGAARLLRHRGRRGPGLLVSPRDAAGHRERLAEIDDRRADTVFVLGRLRAGVGRPQASAALDGVAAGLSREFPDVNEAMRVVLSPPGLFGGMMRGPVLGFTGLLLVIAGLVLLLACVNLANLLLARAIDRRHEVAVRLSIGAGRVALLRQLLIESLMLSSAAGVAGLMLAWWLMRSASAMRLPVDIPIVLDLPLDGRVLLFSVLLSLVTAVMFGLVPALQATKVDLAGVLKDSASSSQRRTVKWRSALIVVQVAVSLVLLTGAGLMWRALGRTQTMALVFDEGRSGGVLRSSVAGLCLGERARDSSSPDRFRPRALPGITQAALADIVPIDLHFGRGVYAEESAAEREVRTPVAHRAGSRPAISGRWGRASRKGAISRSSTIRTASGS